MQQTAATRGWSLDSGQEGGYHVDRWKGTTDGISWVAESLRQISGGKGKRHRARHISRWSAAFTPGVNQPIVCIGVTKGQERISTSVAEGDGLLATLAQKAVAFAFDSALDVYFGDAATQGIDPAKMHRVDGQRIPGYIVMATDEGEGTRVLSEGIERILTGSIADASSILSENVRPWILIRQDSISLARMELQRNESDVERFTQAGVALSRAFRFGRRT